MAQTLLTRYLLNIASGSTRFHCIYLYRSLNGFHYKYSGTKSISELIAMLTINPTHLHPAHTDTFFSLNSVSQCIILCSYNEPSFSSNLPSFCPISLTRIAHRCPYLTEETTLSLLSFLPPPPSHLTYIIANVVQGGDSL